MQLYRLYIASPGHRDGTGRGEGSPVRTSSPVRPSTPTSRSFFNSRRFFRSDSSSSIRSVNTNAVVANLQLPALTTYLPDLNTLPDPRDSMERSMGPGTPPKGDGEQHPDLSNEVSALSTKLINAINHQTSLDDNLQSTRHELEAALERVAQFEQVVKEHRDLIASGLLIRRVDAESEKDKLKRELLEERQLKINAEKQRREMEVELENLTSSLFEEANNMVAEARRDNDRAEKKNDQLRLQLKDSEILLQSHQQQLRELKAVLQEVQAERERNDRPPLTTEPQTPRSFSASEEDASSRSLELQREDTGSLVLKPVIADQPLRFSNIIRPILRSDLAAYDEFSTLYRLAPRTSPPSRINSGNFTGLSLPNLGLSTPHSQSITTIPQTATAILATNHTTSSPASPSLPGSFTPNSPSDPTISLEKSKFYKRLLTEDIDPTLRLDTAPGLSWLQRRSVVSSMLTATLAIEPWPPGSRFYSSAFPCSLCGEQRKEELYVRRHRFRTSDSEDAQRHPLCEYCLERVRATCELVGFLKVCRTGQWRDVGVGMEGSVEEAKSAWEDCVKLRERMFWARIGGGVVPVRQGGEEGGGSSGGNGGNMIRSKDVTGSSMGDDGPLDVVERLAVPLTSSIDSKQEDEVGAEALLMDGKKDMEGEVEATLGRQTLEGLGVSV